MTKPTKREIGMVSKIEILTDQEVKTLYLILQAHGFDIETIAFLWDKDEALVRALFRVDHSGPRQAHEPALTGKDLAFICSYMLNTKPAVIQRRLNFDESRIGTRKVGYRSTPVKLPWDGPASLCVDGNTEGGRVFVQVYRTPGLSAKLPPRSRIDAHVLSQINAGKYPVRLPQLRDVVMAAQKLRVNHPKFECLETALAAFPPGAWTPDEALEAVTTTKPTSASRPTKEKDRDMKVDRTTIFRTEFRARGLGSVVADLISRSAEVTHLLSEFDVDTSAGGLRELRDNGFLDIGEFVPLVTAKWFESLKFKCNGLIEPLLEMYEWWKEKDKEIIAAEAAFKVRPPIQYDDPPNPYRQRPVSTPATPPVKTPAKAPAKVAASTTTAPPERVPIKDHGARILLLCTAMGREVSERNRLILNGENPQFKYLPMSSLKTWAGDIRLPVGVLLGEQNFDLEFTPVLEGSTWHGPHPFFVTGEPKLGRRFSRVIEYYIRERKYFRDQRSIGPNELEKIKSGQAAVSVPIFAELVKRVNARLAENENNIPPMAFKALVELGQAVPAKFMKG